MKGAERATGLLPAPMRINLAVVQDKLREYVEVIWSSLRVADVIDIVVVAVIVYFGISWFRRSRSRLVMSGLATLAVLYFAAGLLEMQLTLALFRAGLTVAVVALVVIFQEEIRRAFERVALASRFRRGSAPPEVDSPIDTVVEAVASFANSKTGALIVFKGREPLERHLKRGVPLNGQVSEPLLHSIFDASSAGHDGALIIENGLATRFAVHLPLAAEASDHRSGTRHSAAVGLSERSDAFVIVVSEERGVISVAEDGRLDPMTSIAELRNRIARFKARITPKRGPDRAATLLTKSFGIKVLSLVVAIGAWLVTFNYRNETVTRSIRAPVLFENVPKGKIVREPNPADLLVAVAGPKAKLERLEAQGVNVLVDVSQAKEGLNRQTVSDAEVPLPRGVVARDLQPSVVVFTVESIVEVTVLVQPRTSGQLPRGLWLKKIFATPPRIKLKVPRSRASLRQVTTEPIALGEIRESSQIRRELLFPQGIELAPGEPKSVLVQIVVGGKLP